MVNERVWFWLVIVLIVLCLAVVLGYAVNCCLEERRGELEPVKTTTPAVDVPVTPPPREEEPLPRVLADGGETMIELLIGGVPLVALIVALVELAKQTLGMESRFAPVLAVGLGMLLAVGIQVSQLFPVFGTWFQVVVLGMVAGLLACGIYSGTKATLGR